MSESPTPTAPQPEPLAPEPKRSRFRRAVRWLLKWSARGFVLLLVLAFFSRAGWRAFCQSDLRAEEARLDAEDPGWRFADIIAARDRAAPPDEQNSAAHVRKVREALPPEWNAWVAVPPLRLGDPAALNRKQSLEELAGGGALEAARTARELALGLRNMPTGFHRVPVGATGMTVNLKDTHATVEVIVLLRADALHAAQTGDPRRALRCAHAILNVGRSIGDEPTLVSAMRRLVSASQAVETAMRALALAEPTGADAELETLRAAFLDELAEPVLYNALRGSRAMHAAVLERIDRLDGAELAGREFGDGPDTFSSAGWYVRLSDVPEDRRRYLTATTQLLRAAKGPSRDLLWTFDTYAGDHKRHPRYPFHYLALSGAQIAARAAARQRADLAASAVLLSCEQFRLKHGRFPNALAELPGDARASMPLDPYSGEPLKFARTSDGITVYTVPTYGALKDQGTLRLTAPLGGDEYGWRLFDEKHRGLPPKPVPVPDPELP